MKQRWAWQWRRTKSTMLTTSKEKHRLCPFLMNEITESKLTAWSQKRDSSYTIKEARNKKLRNQKLAHAKKQKKNMKYLALWQYMPEAVLECITTLNSLGKNVQMQCLVKGLVMVDREKRERFQFHCSFHSFPCSRFPQSLIYSRSLRDLSAPLCKRLTELP